MRFASTILLLTIALTISAPGPALAQSDYGSEIANESNSPGASISGARSPQSTGRSNGRSVFANIDAMIDEGNFEKAAERLRYIDDFARSRDSSERPTDDESELRARPADLTHRLVTVARGLQRSGDLDSAVDFYLRAVVAVTNDRDHAMDTRSKSLVHLSAASALVQADKSPEALDSLLPLFTENAGTSSEHLKMAIRMCLHIGSNSLRQGKLTIAGRAYRIAGKYATDQQKEKAQLGAAWTLATSGENPRMAGEKLQDFVAEFPENADAHRALRLAATCFRQAGDSGKSTATLQRLLETWPESSSAVEIVRSHIDLPINEVPKPIRHWVISRVDDATDLKIPICKLGLRVAAEESAADAVDAFALQLAKMDETGQAVSDLLQQLVQDNRSADAERVAATWIAPQEGAIVTTGAREAACRWAGRQQLWTTLALASELSDPQSDTDSRTPTVERLFAEALMQSGRPADAHLWWRQLVDGRSVTDFATLIRCAETATSHADPDEATRRIDAARAATDGDGARESLVDMLAAELAIRRLDFDGGRSILEKVIRNPVSVSELRGRAQWLIGETYFLQEKFPDAIDSYRRVEGIDPEGQWVAAALVQAGKSFERLGRTREASVCYSNLINRFADSPHSQAARTRMAAIKPQTTEQDNSNSSHTGVKLRR